MDDSPGTLLTIDQLGVSFVQYERGLRRRVVPVIAGMDLSITSGELVAVIGASGAGKTLLAHAVLGLLPANARETGTVTFRGQPLSVAERRRLAGDKIALMPQSVSFLDPMASVGSQVRRAAQLARIPAPAAAARRALRERHLDSSVDRLRPHELSGGMARRVLDVMATLGSPDILFADEPTPGLDAAAVGAALGRLRAMADAGTAVVLITHDLEGALTVADRVVVCRAGRTIESAPVSAFSGTGTLLRSPYTRSLWRALPKNGFAADSSQLELRHVPTRRTTGAS